MLGPIRFVFVIIWFAIGLSAVGTLRECTTTMGKEAAIAHKRGGISYGWWNRSLLDGNTTNTKAIHIPAMATSNKDKNEKDIRGGNILPRSK